MYGCEIPTPIEKAMVKTIRKARDRSICRPILQETVFNISQDKRHKDMLEKPSSLISVSMYFKHVNRVVTSRLNFVDELTKSTSYDWTERYRKVFLSIYEKDNFEPMIAAFIGFKGLNGVRKALDGFDAYEINYKEKEKQVEEIREAIWGFNKELNKYLDAN